MIWIVITFGVMCLFCGLAVDLGRAQTAKTELRRAADAAARAGAMEILKGNTDYSSDSKSVLTIVAEVAKANLADGTPVVLNTSTDIQIGTWNSFTRMFTPTFSSPNAVRVYARRNGAANQNAVPLIFTQVIGRKSLDVWAVSVAQVVTVNTVTNFSVSANSNPWLAGTQNLTPGSETASITDPGYPSSNHPWQHDINGPPDSKNFKTGEPYGSPPVVNLNLQPGDIINLSDVSGTAQNDPNGTKFSANGDQGAKGIYDDSASHPYVNTSNVNSYEQNISNYPTGMTEHYISDTYAPINGMMGVFLNGDVPPTAGGVPALLNQNVEILNFSGTGSNPTQSATYLNIANYTYQGTQYTVTPVSQDYTTLSPKLQQAFYAGDGMNSSGNSQYLMVPEGGSQLYLATMDGHEWSNNVGGFVVGKITQYRIELVQ